MPMASTPRTGIAGVKAILYGKNYVPTIGNRRFLCEGCRVPAGRKAQRVGFLENQGVGRNGPYRQPQRVVPKGVVVTHDDV